MNTQSNPYGLKLSKNCHSCPFREEGFFCNFAPHVLDELNSIGQLSVYPKGAILFWKGQPSQGAFIVCSGRVKVGVASPRGRSVTYKIARGGDVLGLSNLWLNQPQLVNAEILEPAQVKFISRQDFLRLMQAHEEACRQTISHLSNDLQTAYRQVACIVLSPTPQAKLINLLLDWSSGQDQLPENNRRFDMHLTHAQIGELIGVPRETVSRLLGQFRKQGLVQTKGTSITLKEPDKLKALLN